MFVDGREIRYLTIALLCVQITNAIAAFESSNCSAYFPSWPSVELSPTMPANATTLLTRYDLISIGDHQTQLLLSDMPWIVSIVKDDSSSGIIQYETTLVLKNNRSTVLSVIASFQKQNANGIYDGKVFLYPESAVIYDVRIENWPFDNPNDRLTFLNNHFGR